MKAPSLVITVVALLFLGVPLGAATFGSPDNNAHPWVGTLLFQASDGYLYSCTGTLLSPTVMVTAAHCTIDSGVKNLQTWVKFTPQISFADRNGQNLFDYLNDPAHGWIKAAEVIPHGSYTGSYPNSYDVGLVILSTPVNLAMYGALPPLSFLETVPKGNTASNLFTVVGYGMQGYIKPFYGDLWERYTSNTRLVELKSTFNGAEMSAKFTNNPGKTSGGSCYGDSGGPVFYGATNLVTAVVSWGITPCIGVDYNFRLDTPVAQDFILPHLN